MHLTSSEYLYALSHAVERWIAFESRLRSRRGGGGGLPRVPRLALLSALRIIATEARRDDYVAVVVTPDVLRDWLSQKKIRYGNTRDIFYRWNQFVGAGNARYANRERLDETFKHVPRVRLGAAVEVRQHDDGVRVTARLVGKSGSRFVEVATDLVPRDTPLIAQAVYPGGDPLEKSVLITALTYYAQHADAAAVRVIRELASRRGIHLDEVRTHLLSTARDISLRMVKRRYGATEEMEELSTEEVEKIQQWYQWTLRKWQVGRYRTVSVPSSAGAVARRLAPSSDAPQHPDDILAADVTAAKAEERTAALRLWVCDRVAPPAHVQEAMETALRKAAYLVAPDIETILRDLRDAGVIDDDEAWTDRELARLDALEATAAAAARREGGPDLYVQRAIRRLARPRLRGWPEEQARRLVADQTPHPKLAFLRAVIAQYLRWMDLPQLRGDIEQFVEQQLQFLASVYRALKNSTQTQTSDARTSSSSQS
jgi:hypothetical protein